MTGADDRQTAGAGGDALAHRELLRQVAVPTVDEVRLRRLRELGLEERVELEDPFGGNLVVAIARRPRVSRAS